MCMAKQLKPIEGHIAQINAPRFAEDRNMWVMIELLFCVGFNFFQNPNFKKIIYIPPTDSRSPPPLVVD